MENFGMEARYEHSAEGAHEEIIEKNFRLIAGNADAQSGLFSAVDSRIETPASREDHMSEAWIRDTSWNLISILETIESVDGVRGGGETISAMKGFVGKESRKLLALLDQERWLARFRQEVIDNGDFTSLSGEPPEVHLKTDGAECRWDQNQPESWGEMLIAFGKTRSGGIVEQYSADEMRVIRAIAEYLVKIKPWKFAGAGMWEGVPVHSPSSRSNAVVIAKGLDIALPLFEGDRPFQKEINGTVDRTMAFVREDVNTDYTVPHNHENGADLAMLVGMALPETEKTALPFIKYMEENGAKLGIGPLPGAIRFVGDPYKRGEFGEARWFMANPVLAIGYLREAEKEFARDNLEQAEAHRRTADSFLAQALEISRYYGHDSELFPELFIQRDPENVKGKTNMLERNDGRRMVALEPLERSLVWNSALIMTAGALSDRVAKLLAVPNPDL